jgi:hypothetical protein
MHEAGARRGVNSMTRPAGRAGYLVSSDSASLIDQQLELSSSNNCGLFYSSALHSVDKF